MKENTLPIRKNDQVKISVNRSKGIVTRTLDDNNYSFVDCGDNSSGTGWYYNGVLHLTDEVTKRIRAKEVDASNDSDDETPFQHSSLEGVAEGDTLKTSNGTLAVVKNVSALQVVAGSYKFVKSDGSGWGNQEVSAMLVASDDDSPEKVPHHAADVGDHVELSNGDIVEVSKVSKRQIRAGGYKFKRSDGTGWGDQDLFIIATTDK